MSIFRKMRLECPVCATPIDFDVVLSVSADRRPDLREAILDGSFQRLPCPGCGTDARADPEFTYMDIGRGQYIGVWPVEKRADWKTWAEKTRAVFDDALGKNAPSEARGIGAKVDVRVVFGWAALVEKILARGAGIDDRTLELVKLAVMRTRAETPLPGVQELRLVAVEGGVIKLAWVGGDPEDFGPVMSVQRQLIKDIEAVPDAWQAVRASVAEGDVVDFQRELLLAA